ncbi:MAG TPA: amidohydrolase family protein [Xanthobacteraceae bacterium]|jgi:aminocarboxymuconate-semialdehyde decarboxylase|nr:amidohydrolase family protein [Xanthobacteraceae bacterium]
MRVDAFTHFFPKQFFDRLDDIAPDWKDMGKRSRSIAALHDLDVRKKIIDQHKDYQQILSFPNAPLETIGKTPKQMDELARIVNDGYAELCAKEKDYFPGWVAQVSLTSADAGVAEAERAVKQLGALGVQIYTNIAGKPLDRPEFLPFWKKMTELGAPVWLHPTRGAEVPDYITENKSLYEIWWTIGWSYETAAAMLRLVYSKIMDTHPGLKIITHHFAGIVPMLEGRLGPGNDVMGARTTDQDYVSLRKSLKKRPLDYFKQDFWTDTAAFTAEAATKCGMEFFPIDKILFASDCPFDPEGGAMYVRETLRILDSLKMDKATADKVFYKNLEAVTGRKLVK